MYVVFYLFRMLDQDFEIWFEWFIGCFELEMMRGIFVRECWNNGKFGVEMEFFSQGTRYFRICPQVCVKKIPKYELQVFLREIQEFGRVVQGLYMAQNTCIYRKKWKRSVYASLESAA